MIFKKSARRVKQYTEKDLVEMNCAAQESDRRETKMRKQLRSHNMEEEFFSDDNEYIKFKKDSGLVKGIVITIGTVVVAGIGFCIDTRLQVNSTSIKVEKIQEVVLENKSHIRTNQQNIQSLSERIVWLEYVVEKPRK